MDGRFSNEDAIITGRCTALNLNAMLTLHVMMRFVWGSQIKAAKATPPRAVVPTNT